MSGMDPGADVPAGGLPAATADGAARARALGEARGEDVSPTGLVSYVSSGRLALIGTRAEASAVAERIEHAIRENAGLAGAAPDAEASQALKA